MPAPDPTRRLFAPEQLPTIPRGIKDGEVDRTLRNIVEYLRRLQQRLAAGGGGGGGGGGEGGVLGGGGVTVALTGGRGEDGRYPGLLLNDSNNPDFTSRLSTNPCVVQNSAEVAYRDDAAYGNVELASGDYLVGRRVGFDDLNRPIVDVTFFSPKKLEVVVDVDYDTATGDFIQLKQKCRVVTLGPPQEYTVWQPSADCP